jgi:predicted lipid-binding transport protein (Tim44 family)
VAREDDVTGTSTSGTTPHGDSVGPESTTTASADATTPAATPQDLVYPPERTAWIGWIIFAGLMLGMLGAFLLVAGFVALFDEDYFQATGAEPLFLAVDQQTWGWLQLVIGTAAILTAAGLLYGVVLARVIGAGIAVLSAVTNLLAIGAYPVWSVLLIAVNVCVLYAITVHGREMRPSD